MDKEVTMKKSFLSALGIFSLLAIVFGLAGGALAQNPHIAVADTYTDSNNVDMNFGTQGALLLSATRVDASTCTATTYLWFKFTIPSTAQTIANATLNVTFFGSLGTGLLATELRSSADATWGETTLTWSNQPAFEATVLGTSPSVAPGGTAQYGGSGSALATYLNNHKGQDVSLIVRADCSSTVDFYADRVVLTKESFNNGIGLDLFNPTAVGLLSFSGASSSFSPWSLLLVTGLVLLALTVYLVLHRREPAR